MGVRRAEASIHFVPVKVRALVSVLVKVNLTQMETMTGRDADALFLPCRTKTPEALAKGDCIKGDVIMDESVTGEPLLVSDCS